MATSEADTQHLLYEDENGKVIGLDEVQLLDPIPVNRIPALQSLLEQDDLYVAYQAALVLAAWGDKEGLEKIEEFIDNEIHRSGEFAPHRIDDYDNVYDDLAYAVHLSGLSGSKPQDRKRPFAKLLLLYGRLRFESKLKHALLKSDFPDLAPQVQAAIERSLANGQAYLASQLLPVLARWQPDSALKMIPRFLSQPLQTPDPAVNVAEALGHINRPDGKQLLMRLRKHSNPVVAEEASQALKKIAG